MVEPKRDNLLLMPKNRRSELSAALRDLLGRDLSNVKSTKRREDRRPLKKESSAKNSINTAVNHEPYNNSLIGNEFDNKAELQGNKVMSSELRDDELKEADSVNDDSLYDEGILDDSVGNDSKDDFSRIEFVKTELISTSPYQTRDIAGDSEIDMLSQSILSNGIIQPIVVRKLRDGDGFELIAGERRLRAARRAGLTKIPAIIKDVGDKESAEISIIENAQRENLNPVEEALAFKAVHEQFGMTQKEIAQLAGKSRVFVTNSLRLLQLHPEVIECVKTGELSAGHARALLMVSDEKVQCRLARKAISQQLSVRALEHLVSQINNSEQNNESNEEKEQLNVTLTRAKAKVQSLLDMELVSLCQDNKGRRRLQLTFETEAQWKRFLGKIR